MSKWRYTFAPWGGGQRPYGPTIRRWRVLFEWQGMEGYKNTEAPFIVAEGVGEDTARREAKNHSGWAEEGEGDHFSTRLTYIKKVAPGTWEWETNTPYDD